MGNYIAYDNLRIATFDLKYIRNMEIENQLNDHATLKLSGILKEEVQDIYLIATDDETPIEVYYEDGEEHYTIFNGIVTNIKEKVLNNVYLLEIEAKSFTCLMDRIKYQRDFQDVNMTTHTLIEEVMKSYPSSRYEINIPNESIGEFILQYNETDFQFLKRIVSRYNQGTISAMEEDGIALYFGTPSIEVKPQNSINNYNIKKDLDEYNEIKNNDKVEVSEINFVTYTIRTQELFRVGENFEFNGQKLYVKKAMYLIDEGKLENTYELRIKEGIMAKKIYNEEVIGISINGTILEVKRDRVKVSLEISANLEKEKAYWFPYATVAASPDGGGWYCMPEIGEPVRVNCPTKEEKRAFAISAIDKHDAEEPNEDDRMSNPDDKSIKTDSGQEVKFTPNGILIECDGGQAKVDLNKDGTIEITGQKNINITCAKGLTLRAENELTIDAKEKVDMLCEKGSSLIMSSEDKIEIKGKRVHNNG
jgi:phage baseplate assembly protein gpV